MRSLLLILLGAVVATTVVIACGDDTATVDAAQACDCEPSEPPLASRIRTVFDERTNVPADGVGSSLRMSAGCEDGEILLGGGCELTTQNADQHKLYVAGEREPEGETDPAYGCHWLIGQGFPIEKARVWATCLTPAEPVNGGT